jgi:transposase InsO family protein
MPPARRRRGHKWTTRKRVGKPQQHKQPNIITWQEALDEIYDTLGKPGALSSSPDTLKRELMSRFKIDNVSLNKISKWLATKVSHSVHKRADVHFTRNPVIAPDIDHQWQIDLLFLDRLARSNKGFKIILVAIDVVSRFAWAQPMKNKTGISTTEAFFEILKRARPRKPKKIQSDKGTEFLNNTFQQLLRKHDIEHFTTYSDTKAALAERFVQTLKKLIHKYLTQNDTLEYIDQLQSMMDTYNATIHSSTKFAPNSITESNLPDVLTNLYGHLWETDLLNVRVPKFKIDDYVRVSKVYSSVFRKSYEGNWSKEIFRVSSIKDTYPRVTYGISDSKGEEIMGSYYENEMQRVSPVEAHLQHWEIDKILDTREVNADQGFGKTKQHLIRWKKDGKVLPDEFNEWVYNRQVPWTQRPVV